jgi:hypothetical protein
MDHAKAIKYIFEVLKASQKLEKGGLKDWAALLGKAKDFRVLFEAEESIKDELNKISEQLTIIDRKVDSLHQDLGGLIDRQNFQFFSSKLTDYMQAILNISRKMNEVLTSRNPSAWNETLIPRGRSALFSMYALK